MLDGEVDFHTDLYAPVRLSEGDSIYFESSMAHGYIAATQGLCRILSICSVGDLSNVFQSQAADTCVVPIKTVRLQSA